MEGIIAQRVTPLLKCMVLFLFIFTAKVLTTRPQESQDSRNGIHQLKPSHYVRTFTRYHHRRTIQWNNDDFVDDDPPRVIQKRNAEISNSEEFIGRESVPFSNDGFGFEKDAISATGKGEKGAKTHEKNSVSNDSKKYKVKAAFIPTEAPRVVTSSISCIYQSSNIAMSATSSYDDDENTQYMVENDNFEPGNIINTTLPDGEKVQVEQCNGPNNYCYMLWHEDNDGNITVLGQGCWRAGAGGCGRCSAARALPATRFCCCARERCNRRLDQSFLEEETVTMKAESTINNGSESHYTRYVAWTVLLVLTVVGVIVFVHVHCRRRKRHDSEVEKGEVMGTGPDALATGLLCVDNLTLIEHIGQGKFGSVWRGSLGSTPVAVKLYSNVNAWQKEAAIYALPHLAHPNILRYYGSDSRSTLEGGRSHLIVVELCPESLRSRLMAAPLSWAEFASLAHGLAAALAHLHTPMGSKPCIVHRDVNSNNVLVCGNTARLADLGLAQILPPRNHQGYGPLAARQGPTRIAEAGTLRYLAPEALEGALDLSEARAALCAVDVFALALVLWEMLWRTAPAHAGPAPPYAPPYAHLGLPARPTAAQMQSMVSRNKSRPPLPAGPVAEARALKIAADTCDECWDHDAEARLTAVCVEERMAELKQLLQAQGPIIHDNNLHPHQPDAPNPPPEPDKNSNCTAACDVTTPLLYPQPHFGRNACIERNTAPNPQPHVTLIHKSLKDISTPPEAPRVQNIENCLSVARVSHRPIPDFENSDRLNEIRSYQRPLEYVPNDVSCHDVERKPKDTNLLQEIKIEKPKWGIRKFFEKKLSKTKLETEVKLVPEVLNGRARTSIVNGRSMDRPSNLILEERAFNFEVPCLSPPNRTLSPTMLMESDMNRENRVFGFKELPSRDDEPKTQNQIFAVIVPKAKPADFANIEMRNTDSDSVKNSVRTSMSSQSIFKSGQSESEDSTVKKRLSSENKINNTNNSGGSSRASINLELQYIDNQTETFNTDSPFDLNSDCSSSEDEHLMLLSENGGSKITMQTIPKPDEKKKYQNEVLKETKVSEVGFNKINKYTNFDNEFSDPNDKENLVGYSGDNPVYIAAMNGEIDTADYREIDKGSKSPKSLKNLMIKRQHSLEQVSEIFSSSGDVNLQNPAGRVKTPGDLPVAIRRARRDRALQKGRANECNRLSLYDDRMMFGNSL